MIDPDGVHAVEQYVLAKYYMTTNVYRHKVRLITDQMIIRAIVLGIEADGLEDLRKIYAFDNTAEFFQEYTRWTDARLMFHFDEAGKPGTRCGKLLGRLQDRRLSKRIYFEQVAGFDS